MTSIKASVQLHPGREKSLLRRHPWIFSGAIAVIHGEVANGETVDVLDAQGHLLARGAYSQHSQIRVRIWSWNLDEQIDESFFHRRLSQSLAYRTSSEKRYSSNASRLVHAESDGLPGLIVDRYDDTLVVQLLSSGPERWRDLISDLLMELTGSACVFERSDVDIRKLEGLPSRTGILRGSEPPELIEIHENNLRFLVNVRDGHKTGFYLDQRANRGRISVIAKNRQVLDCFAYTGGFSISALAGQANRVTMIESSADAIGLAKLNLDINQLAPEKIEWIEEDVFTQLRSFRDQGRTYDLIVLDPPKFAPTFAQAQRAARGYKDINLLAFKLLRPGGILATFSCSGGVSQDLFQKIVASAALDAGVDAQIVDYFHQAYDHPVSLNFPEGGYLKGFLIRTL